MRYLNISSACCWIHQILGARQVTYSRRIPKNVLFVSGCLTGQLIYSPETTMFPRSLIFTALLASILPTHLQLFTVHAPQCHQNSSPCEDITLVTPHQHHTAVQCTPSWHQSPSLHSQEHVGQGRHHDTCTHDQHHHLTAWLAILHTLHASVSPKDSIFIHDTINPYQACLCRICCFQSIPVNAKSTLLPLWMHDVSTAYLGSRLGCMLMVPCVGMSRNSWGSMPP
jgi:hypothetical protein